LRLLLRLVSVFGRGGKGKEEREGEDVATQLWCVN
jgi:hypothetical protein